MSSHKRKRSLSQHLPRDAINPLSYREGTIKQLRTAGLTADDLLPSNYIPDFPHRPIRPSHQGNQPDDGAGHDDEPGRDGSGSASSSPGARGDSARKARQRRDAQDKQLGILTEVMLRALDEGDIPRAKRAFGLACRSEARGKPVDLRKNALWSLGAEILMRDGEERSRGVLPAEGGGAPRARGSETPGAAPGERARRWGSAANMPRLRAYLESLVRQHPYSRLHPDSVSDLDFHPVLFGCELYDAWAEHRLALGRLADESEAWSDGDGDGAREGDHDGRGQALSGRERRLRQAKADLARRALSAVRDVAARMDALMENAPYSRSAELLRLRGMVALYMGDLSVPPAPRTAAEEDRGGRARALERERARALFARMAESGGRPDACTERWLLREGSASDDDYGADGDGEDDYQGSQWGALPTFSSMHMR